MVSAGVQSKVGSGEWRSGKKLVKQTPLKERQVKNRLHCFAFCERLPDCHAFNFGAVSATANCQLLAEGACSGHQLVADPAVDYYDVYPSPTPERQLPHWDEPSCVRDGYCSVNCSVVESCATDAQCQRPELPAGSHRCLNNICQWDEDHFWEVRPDLHLPKWMSWTADMYANSFKKLKPGQCELDVKLKLGVGAKWEFKAVTGYDDPDFEFIINENLAEIKSATPVSKPTAQGFANTQNFTHLKLSWCSGVISMGPVDNPMLLSVLGATKPTYDFVLVKGENNESSMYIDSGVADPWLFEESGTASDPVFEISGPGYPTVDKVLIARYIDPSDDVTVKYDCMSKSSCYTYFYLSTTARITAVIGGGGNMDYKLALRGQAGVETCCRLTSATPICNELEFVTFAVRCNRGRITIFRNNDTEPAFDASAPEHWLPPHDTVITRVGFGHSKRGMTKLVRVARYDAGWATDTWLTKGTGFSSMAFERP